jgi:hypothetical protein
MPLDWATQTSVAELPADEMKPAPVWSNSVSKEGHFTFLAETVSLPYLDYNCIGLTQTP